eukprot:TRINITY_DN4549_c0_g1_i9.p1 TRINITY_DN4549_c0_g1~~TRINITY_DN4549_c0_g1_i9.p1  ORF type:complete len:260 (-),score=-25.26 TRINITY_DN4549_c0_g1_i9:88-867(-)
MPRQYVQLKQTERNKTKIQNNLIEFLNVNSCAVTEWIGNIEHYERVSRSMYNVAIEIIIIAISSYMYKNICNNIHTYCVYLCKYMYVNSWILQFLQVGLYNVVNIQFSGRNNKNCQQHVHIYIETYTHPYIYLQQHLHICSQLDVVVFKSRIQVWRSNQLNCELIKLYVAMFVYLATLQSFNSLVIGTYICTYMYTQIHMQLYICTQLVVEVFKSRIEFRRLNKRIKLYDAMFVYITSLQLTIRTSIQHVIKHFNQCVN